MSKAWSWVQIPGVIRASNYAQYYEPALKNKTMGIRYWEPLSCALGVSNFGKLPRIFIIYRKQKQSRYCRIRTRDSTEDKAVALSNRKALLAHLESIWNR